VAAGRPPLELGSRGRLRFYSSSPVLVRPGDPPPTEYLLCDTPARARAQL